MTFHSQATTVSHSTPSLHPGGGAQNYSKDSSNSGLATVQYQYSALTLSTKNTALHNLPNQSHTGQPLHLRHKVISQVLAH